MLRFKEWLAEQAKKENSKDKEGKAIKFYHIKTNPKTRKADGSDRTRLELESAKSI